MDARRVVVFTTRHAPHAQLFDELLAEQGVEADVVFDTPEPEHHDPAQRRQAVIRLLVDAADAEFALTLARRFVEELAEYDPFEAESLADESTEKPPEEIDHWPTCPRCQSRRTAVCPYCGTAGSQFQPASTAPVDEPNGVEPQWICSTCDEPIGGRYLRSCEWCGWRFDDGIQPDRPEPMTEFDTRLICGILGLTALVFALFGYFAYVLRAPG